MYKQCLWISIHLRMQLYMVTEYRPLYVRTNMCNFFKMMYTHIYMCLAACIHRLLQGFSFFWIHVVHGEGPHIPSVYHKAGLCLHQVSVKRCRCIVNLCTHTLVQGSQYWDCTYVDAWHVFPCIRLFKKSIEDVVRSRRALHNLNNL